MQYLAIILITMISGVVGTGLGGVVGAVLKRDSNKIVSLLLSFAAGIMLAVVCFDLMSEPLEMMKTGELPKTTPIIVVDSRICARVCAQLFDRQARQPRGKTYRQESPFDGRRLGRTYPCRPL